jgi:hypothetical protein
MAILSRSNRWAKARREVPNQQRDVFPPLSQRRNAQLDDG